MNFTKRCFDLAIGVPAFLLLIVPMLIIAILVKFNSKGPILYWSVRVGRHNKTFVMPKFRSMKVDTPVLATHLLQDPSQYLTAFGKIIRKTSLDELPQIWSVIKGDMSLVGPRPALFNQRDLIQLRTERRIESLVPGLTGWAQVNGRDELSIFEKVKFDEEYLVLHSTLFDIKILCITFLRILNQDSIFH